jgi:hypothetical protein
VSSGSASERPGHGVAVWSLIVVATLSTGAATWSIGRHGYTPTVAEGYRIEAVVFLDLAAFYAFAAVGAVLARRRPSNLVGWLLLGIGAVLTMQEALSQFAGRAYLEGPVDTTAMTVDWLASWLWMVSFGLLPLLVLRFPDGRLATHRARWVERAALLAVGGMVLLVPAMLWSERSPVVRLNAQEDEGAILAVLVVLLPLLMLSLAGAGVSLIGRFRRSRGVERQQLRWAAAAAGGFILFLVVGAVADVTGWVALGVITEIGGGLAIAAFPVAVGVAVLRYRLYDLDRIISRTVSYALLTVTLAGLYVLGVVGLGAVVRGLTGGAGGDLVVAASTLLVAAAFGPARRRIQDLMDRRFNRARYDAERVVATFAHRLREDLDLEHLRGELTRVARSTVHPTHSTVWLVPVAEGRR